jgi:hypothetical protein
LDLQAEMASAAKKTRQYVLKTLIFDLVGPAN